MTTIPEQIIGRYVGRTAASQAFTERARQVLPGGDTRTGIFYSPYPAGDITRAVDPFSAALHVLKPYVAEAYPALRAQ